MRLQSALTIGAKVNRQLLLEKKEVLEKFVALLKKYGDQIGQQTNWVDLRAFDVKQPET